MNFNKTLSIVLLICFVFTFGVHAEGIKFRSDDPIQTDPDTISIPKPNRVRIARMHDFLKNSFTDPGGSKDTPAQNINTLGEVPDSSWFTNRIGKNSMSPGDVARGPNQSDGPDLSKPWLILETKRGAQPGFVIRDARGDDYFIKFDAPNTPEAQSAAEVITTKILYAAGYNVPENYIAYIRTDQLRIDTSSSTEVTQKDVDQKLAEVPKTPDGRIRVLASLRLEGAPLGGFRFFGTRTDDANDIVPHENRRELRGYRIFSSWLNHTDSDSENTLDLYVAEGDRNYVKHYLIDFGSTLGSTAQGSRSERAGNEYQLDWGPTFRSILTLGLRDRPWRHLNYPRYPAVGRFEADHFQPEHWKPDHPNPAFERMHADDAFWAVRILSRFTDDIVKAIVHTAEISDPSAEQYLAETLIKRRDKIIRYYLTQTNPLADFAVTGETLSFRNLGVDRGLGSVQKYQYEWYRFDNETGALTPMDQAKENTSEMIPIPSFGNPYMMVRIRSVSSDQKSWAENVEVYITKASTLSIVGIERTQQRSDDVVS